MELTSKFLEGEDERAYSRAVMYREGSFKRRYKRRSFSSIIREFMLSVIREFTFRKNASLGY